MSFKTYIQVWAQYNVNSKSGKKVKLVAFFQNICGMFWLLLFLALIPFHVMGNILICINRRGWNTVQTSNKKTELSLASAFNFHVYFKNGVCLHSISKCLNSKLRHHFRHWDLEILLAQSLNAASGLEVRERVRSKLQQQQLSAQIPPGKNLTLASSRNLQLRFKFLQFQLFSLKFRPKVQIARRGKVLFFLAFARVSILTWHRLQKEKSLMTSAYFSVQLKKITIKKLGHNMLKVCPRSPNVPGASNIPPSIIKMPRKLPRIKRYLVKVF